MRPRVLIAAPDPLLLAAYRVFLAPEGVEVVTAATRSECLAALQGTRPDLLILDAQLLNETTGDAPELFGQTGEPAIPLLILTADPEAWTWREVPPVDYGLLIKPVGPAALAGLIHAVLDRKATPLAEVDEPILERK
jgi:DNA-binding response OmpR family regulator